MADINNFFASLGGGGGITYGGPPLPNISSSTGEDGGTVNRLAKIISGGITKHSSTAELVSKILPYSGFSIVGHGNHGLFETGAGPSGYSDSTVVDFDNEHAWGSEFAKLWKPSRVAYDARGNAHHYPGGGIWIYACCTGGGVNGKAFLQRIADITNSTVIAYTGLIYVSSKYILYERGHTLVQVWPTGFIRNKVSIHNKDDFYLNVLDEADISLPPPSQDLFNIDGTRNEIFLRKMDLNNIDSVLIQRRIDGKSIQKEFNSNIDYILQCLFNSQPFQKSGGVTGIITAVITINYRNQAPQTVNVFADKLAEKIHSGESYMTTPHFFQVMGQLFGGY